MKSSIVAALFFVSTAPPAWAAEEATTSPPLRQIVDKVVVEGSAVVHNGDRTIRLVRDQSQCAQGEQFVPIWINFFDVRQHLSGYTCRADN
jgi:hypothetical protein